MLAATTGASRVISKLLDVPREVKHLPAATLQVLSLGVTRYRCEQI